MSFQVKKHQFTIPSEDLVGYLKVLADDFPHEVIRLDDVEIEEMEAMKKYLVNDIIPKDPLKEIYLKYQLYDDRTLAILEEDFMREHMYDPEYENHPIVTDNYYNLVEITESFWNNFQVGKDNDPNDHPDELITCNPQYPVKRKWSEIIDILNDEEFSHVLRARVAIAGGYVFSTLFNIWSNDIDIFFYGQTPKESIDVITELEAGRFPQFNKYIRKKHVIENISTRHQYILRSYQTFSEILHGFDVDCCCLGWDGKSLWMTRRCQIALEEGFNLINWDRMSPSYEWRLAKYSARGIPVRVKDLDRALIDLDSLDEYVDVIYQSYDPFYRHKKLKKFKGLDILLLMERVCQNKRYNKNVLRGVGSVMVSDYAGTEVTENQISSFYETDLISYLLSSESRKLYPEKYEAYKKHAVGYLNQLLVIDSLEEFIANKWQMRSRRRPDGVLYKSSNPLYRKTWYLKSRLLKDVLSVEENFYELHNHFKGWHFPRKAEDSFKQTQPGQQMTGTFHKSVYEDRSKWWHQTYYLKPGEDKE